jgi:hypothetical protein
MYDRTGNRRSNIVGVYLIGKASKSSNIVGVYLIGQAAETVIL